VVGPGGFAGRWFAKMVWSRPRLRMAGTAKFPLAERLERR
jgi:hypothetical protein